MMQEEYEALVKRYKNGEISFEQFSKECKKIALDTR